MKLVFECGLGTNNQKILSNDFTKIRKTAIISLILCCSRDWKETVQQLFAGAEVARHPRTSPIAVRQKIISASSRAPKRCAPGRSVHHD